METLNISMQNSVAKTKEILLVQKLTLLQLREHLHNLHLHNT